MRRFILIGLLALGTAACERTERDMTPIPAPEGTDAPLYDEGVDPAESPEEL